MGGGICCISGCICVQDIVKDTTHFVSGFYPPRRSRHCVRVGCLGFVWCLVAFCETVGDLQELLVGLLFALP